CRKDAFRASRPQRIHRTAARRFAGNIARDRRPDRFSAGRYLDRNGAYRAGIGGTSTARRGLRRLRQHRAISKRIRGLLRFPQQPPPMLPDYDASFSWRPRIVGARRYFPLNRGLRFSMKAVRPSLKSSLSMQAVPIALIASMSRLSGSFSTCAMVILA